jgi:DNA-binding transcriptional regulator of glucitol operon
MMRKGKGIIYAWVVIQNYSIHLKNMTQARVGPLFMIMFQGRLEPKQIINLFFQEQSIIALIAKDITDMFLMMDQLQPLNDIVITE